MSDPKIGDATAGAVAVSKAAVRFERLWGQPWVPQHQFVVVFRNTVGHGTWRPHSEHLTLDSARNEALDATGRYPEWEVGVAYETQSWEFVEASVRGPAALTSEPAPQATPPAVAHSGDGGGV